MENSTADGAFKRHATLSGKSMLFGKSIMVMVDPGNGGGPLSTSIRMTRVPRGVRNDQADRNRRLVARHPMRVWTAVRIWVESARCLPRIFSKSRFREQAGDRSGGGFRLRIYGR